MTGKGTSQIYGIDLDEQGYCSLAELLAAVRKEPQWTELGSMKKLALPVFSTMGPTRASLRTSWRKA
ncbi:hypothetical protein [Paenibacillus thiaminolyticus]|uniref:hypothetical protein n=1 Tax=Paenibacillus thiaminolyticus TaxID=49283 RepID=UPI00198173B7|nr:hypothetical protein [Paenibacillus thiaminolyticus]